MYRIERVGPGADLRLQSDQILTPADFKDIARALGIVPEMAQKLGYVAAYRAQRRERINTRSNGLETSNVAEVGDWIVTNMRENREFVRDTDGNLNLYVIKANTFEQIYEPSGATTSFGDVYRSKALIETIPFPGGFDIRAPWNEQQAAKGGVVALNGNDVYGIEAAVFEATYDVLGPATRRMLKPGRKRMLALDGGGVRGMLTLAFLEKIEQVLRDQHGNPKMVLADYFDMIGGTSVGAFLAAQLALGDEVADIKHRFKDWCHGIFNPPSAWRAPQRLLPIIGKMLVPKYDERKLEERLNERFADLRLRSPQVKTGLCIITKRVDTGSPWVLTNNPRAKYWSSMSDRVVANKNYRLADIVRASAAAPYYFKPHSIEVSRGNAERPGLFVDGAISPFNNPSLQMLMLAGIRGYGLDWRFGADNLLMISVGTGSFRQRIADSWIMARPAVEALTGMIGDGETLTLTLLQWMGASDNYWQINSEIGDLSSDFLGQGDGLMKPLLRFQRYDAPLELGWLKKQIDFIAPESQLVALRDITNPHTLPALHEIGRRAAHLQIKPEHFPEPFKIESVNPP